MATGQTTTVRALQGDTLDLLCQRHLGATASTVEATLALNSNLADLGPILPTGTPVTLPAMPTRAIANTLKLWD